MTGGRGGDFKAANIKAKMGESLKSPIPGYTWHHVDDFNKKNNTCTMQLVRTDAHRATYTHKGSVAQYEKYYDIKYKK